jgi:hypothetical protein
MTTTLNATTSNGLVVTPDNSGNVLLQYNGQSAPAFSAYQGTNQSIPSATQTKVTIDTEEFDTNNNFASSRFTPTVAGYYQINGSIQTNGSQQYLSSSIFKNGTIYKYGGFGTTMYQSSVSSLVYLNGSTDYVELYVYGATGFNSQNGIQATYFNGCLLRGA